jgi:membrane associated rhomboid family serine protease
MVSSYVILLLTIFISYIGFKYELIKYSLCLWPNRFKQIWRLFTYSFVHSDKSHLIVNTFFYCIGFFGLFQKMSNIQFIYFYFLSTIISVIPEIIKESKSEFSTLTGNSSIGFSILFGTISMDPNKIWGIFDYGLPCYYFGIIYFIISLIESKINNKISLSSHLVGIVFGILYVLYFIK